MPATTSLSARIKRVLPQPVKSALKDVFGTVDPLLVQMYRLTSPNGAPIPPRQLRARVGSSGIGRFREAGERCTASIISGCAKLGRDLSSFERVLDFGCGCGRTIQFTGRQVKAMYGCDVDSEAIAWMQQAYGDGKFLSNKYDPPLPFEANFFDLVYSISIFTHLPEKKQWQWLREIRRVLRPGAAALLSVQGEHAYGLFRSGSMNVSANLLSRLRAHKPLSTEPFIYEQYDHFAPGVGEFSGMDDSYGLTFHSEAYLKDRWGELFEIVAVLPASVDNLQDLVVVRAN